VPAPAGRQPAAGGGDLLVVTANAPGLRADIEAWFNDAHIDPRAGRSRWIVDHAAQRARRIGDR